MNQSTLDTLETRRQLFYSNTNHAPYDLCQCGALKSTRSVLCAACHFKEKARSRQDRMNALIGETFGHLTVTACIGPDPTHRGHYFLKCVCDCGAEVVRRRASLRYCVASCGSCELAKLNRKQYGNTFRRLRFGEANRNHLYSQYRRGAVKREIVFTLTMDEFCSLTRSNCFYCGKPPGSVHTGRNNYGHYVYNGIDRIRNSEGYIAANCVPCCRPCNAIKNAITEEMVRKLYSMYCGLAAHTPPASR